MARHRGGLPSRRTVGAPGPRASARKPGAFWSGIARLERRVWDLEGDHKAHGRIEWQAETRLFVGLRDAKSVLLSLDDRPLDWLDGGVPTDSGSGVDLQITARGIVEQSAREDRRDEERVAVTETATPLVWVGHVEETDLVDKLPGFARNRDAYQPNSVILSRIEDLNPSLNLVCFFGTWDPLSEEVVPRLLRIIQLSYLPEVSLNLVGVDRELKDKAGMAEFHRVQGLPTILFLSRGHELGRIVGQPGERIESQFLEIAERANVY